MSKSTNYFLFKIQKKKELIKRSFWSKNFGLKSRFLNDFEREKQRFY